MEPTETTLKPNEYRCALCKGVFVFGWTDEEAKAELEKHFPGMPKEECSIVCDECYKRIMNND